MIDPGTAKIVDAKIRDAYERLAAGGTVRQFTLDVLWLIRDCLGVRLTDLAERIKAAVPPANVATLPVERPCCPYCGEHTAENVEAVELVEGDGAWADEITCGECGGVYRIVWRYVRVEGIQAPEKVSD
jgi:hypothetical protein